MRTPTETPHPRSTLHRARRWGPVFAGLVLAAAVSAIIASGNSGAAHAGDPVRLVTPVELRAEFGTAVDTDGTQVIVGAPGTNTAHVFISRGDTWEGTELSPPGTSAERFGAAVAIDGDLAVVGAPATDNGRGSVVIFERTGAGWTSGRNLTLPHGPIRGFGTAVAVDEGTIAVGAPRSMGGHGVVGVYRSSAATSPAVVSLKRPRGDDLFGWSVAVSGDLVVAGAPGRNGTGAVVVAAPSTSRTILELGVPSGVTGLGWSVATDGSIIAAGAPRSPARAGDAVIDENGAIAVWEANGDGSWTSVPPTDVFGDPVGRLRLGWSVDVDRGRVVVGMLGIPALVSGPTPAHVVAVLEPGRGDVSLQTTQAFGDTPGFGRSVAMAGSLLVVGAPFDDLDRGLAPERPAEDRPRFGSAWLFVDENPGPAARAGQP